MKSVRGGPGVMRAQSEIAGTNSDTIIDKRLMVRRHLRSLTETGRGGRRGGMVCLHHDVSSHTYSKPPQPFPYIMTVILLTNKTGQFWCPHCYHKWQCSSQRII